MRILMLGNSFTFTNHMPQMLAGLTAASLPLGFSFSQYIVPLPALAVRYMDSR